MLTNDLHITKLYVSGSNTQGQTGLDMSEKQFVIPRPCHFGVQIIQISCGYYHSLMLVKGGLVYQTGNQNSAPAVLPLKNISQIEAGGWHNMAQSEDFDLYSWGRGEDGQLGLETQVNHSNPQLIQIQRRPYQFALGGYHTLIWSKDEVLSCGKGTFGQLGHKNTSSLSKLTKLDIPNIHLIHCGETHTLLLDKSNKLWICGVMEKTYALSPTVMKLPQNIEVVNICAGRKDSAIIGSKGELYIINDQNYQLIDIKTNKIRMKSDSYIIQDQDGRIYSWGKNNYGELGHGDIEDRPKPTLIRQTIKFIISKMDQIINFDLGETHAVFLSSKQEQERKIDISSEDQKDYFKQSLQSSLRSSKMFQSNQQADQFNQPNREKSNPFQSNQLLNQQRINEKENYDPQEEENFSEIKADSSRSEYNPEISQYHLSIHSILKDRKIAELQLEMSSKEQIINQLKQQMSLMEIKNVQNQTIIKELRRQLQ